LCQLAGVCNKANRSVLVHRITKNLRFWFSDCNCYFMTQYACDVIVLLRNLACFQDRVRQKLLSATYFHLYLKYLCLYALNFFVQDADNPKEEYGKIFEKDQK